MTISRETAINVVLALLLLAVPFIAMQLGKPFYVTLATRMAILGLAAIGLNIALGLGGLVSFGHAAFSASAAMRPASWPAMPFPASRSISDCSRCRAAS